MISKTLGRGLDSLISSTTGELSAQVVEIPLEDISPNPLQPRKGVAEASLEDLAQSIRAHGVLQPIVVQRLAQGYQLVAGERRVRAARLAGREGILALIVRADEMQSLEMALIENIQRVNLGPLEEAAGYEVLIEHAGITHQELAERVGKSRSTITNTLRLLDLPDKVKGLIRSGALTAGQARPLLGAGSSRMVENLAEKAAKQNWSAREVERRVRSTARPPGRSQSQPSEKKLPEYCETLRNLYGTKVSIKDDHGRGEIRLEFYSVADRDRLLHLLITGGRTVRAGAGA